MPAGAGADGAREVAVEVGVAGAGDVRLGVLRLPAVGVGLVLLNLATTALVQVPLHRRLSAGWDDRAIRTLVASNWVRTAAWTARAVILLLV